MTSAHTAGTISRQASEKPSVADQNDQDLRVLRAAAAEKGAVQDLTRSINLFALNTLLEAASSASSSADVANVSACVSGMSARLADLTRELDIQATLLH